MSAPENNGQHPQGFVLPKKKRKQISSSVLAGLILLIIMVGSLYWFQHQAQLKKEMDALIETNNAISSNATENASEKPTAENLPVKEEGSEDLLAVSVVDETEKQIPEVTLEAEKNVKESSTSNVTSGTTSGEETVALEPVTEENNEERISVSLGDSQPLFENILAREEAEKSEESDEAEQEDKKIVVEFDVDNKEAAVAQKEIELSDISSTLMAFENLSAVRNDTAIQVNFALKNLVQVKHRGKISFALIQADGTRVDIENPQGTYSFRMRVEKKYDLPITADNKALYENAYAVIVDIKDGSGKVLLSKAYKF